MSFDLGGIVIRVDQAKAALDQTRAGLEQTEQAAEDTAKAMGKLGEAAGKAGDSIAYGMKKGAETVGATGETFSDFFDKLDRDQKRVLEQIRGPWARYQADLAATNALFRAGAISMGEFEGASGRLADRLEALQRRDLSPQLRLEIDLFNEITGPIKRYEAELAALQSMLAADQISLEQFDAALGKTQKRAQSSGAIGAVQGPVFKQELAGLADGPMLGPTFDPNQAGRGISEELKREEDILKRITGPMKQYEQEVAALDSLLKKGAIDEETFNREMEKAQKLAGRGLGPVLGPRPPSDQGGGGGDGHGVPGAGVLEAIAPKFGAAGEGLAKFVTTGTVAAGVAVALGTELVHLGDEYIVLYNKAQKVTDAGYSINETLHEQLELSKQLHGSLDATLELYDAVRDGTDELNLSQKQQVDLARDIGQAVLADGKSIEAAEGLMKRLTYAFASGAISGRDLKSILREFPDIGAAFVATLGHSRNELVAMANKGQISAEMLIDAFRRINKEMAEKVDKQIETSGQKWQHFKDTILIGLPSVPGKIADFFAGSETSDFLAQQERLARAQREAAEAAKLNRGEQERNAKTAQLADVAGKLGIDFGPFNKEQADAIAALRIQLSQFGIETPDAFEKAHARASLFGRKLEEIQERKDAENIADDVKRIWMALHGADDILEDQQKKWHAIADQARTAAQAAEKFRAAQPYGPMDPQRAQMQRELDLSANNAQTAEADAQYGQKMVGYAQGLNNARAELDNLNRAAKEGKIHGEDLRKQYDALMTTLNDGRLPETIKIWESIHLPIEQAERDIRALNAMFRQGRLDVSEYTAELAKIANTHLSGDASILAENIAVIDKRLADGQITLGGYDNAVKKLTESFAELRKTSSGISYRVAPNLSPGSGGLLPNVDPSGLRSVNTPDLQKILAQTQTTEMFSSAGEKAHLFNQEMERANKLADEFVEPAVKYEERLGDITRALELNSITEGQANAARRRAREEYDNATESLEKIAGPTGEYEAALKHLNNQLERGDISQKQFGDGVDKARIAMLQATGAADEFKGALEIDWIKAKQGADSFGASVENAASADLGKFNEGFITALTGGGEAAKQTRDQLAKLSEEYAKGKISATDYAKKQEELNEQLSEQTDVWANISSSFGSFVDSMIQDIERLIIKWAEMQAIKGLVSLFSSSGGGDGVSNLMSTNDTLSLLGYAEGGTGLVKGSGGVDSQIVAFRATPGERVTITPPGAYPYMPASSPSAGSTAAAGRGAPVVQVHNHYDADVVTAGISSGAGQTAVLNVLRANRAAIRATLGIS